MGRSRKVVTVTGLVAMLLLTSVAWTAMGTQATILTTQGGTASGTLSGLGPLIQLRAPYGVQIIGPHQQYDLPLSVMRQITLDFPRVIIETVDSVIIGPYSAFMGLGETLTLSTGTSGQAIRIPIAAVRAISLHGAALRPVPREWMGDRFLSEPEITAARQLTPATCDDCTVTPAPVSSPALVEDESPVIWGTFTPEIVEEEPAFPWWIGLVAVAILLGVFLFVNPGGSS